jgi:hypothetical protein
MPEVTRAITHVVSGVHCRESDPHRQLGARGHHGNLADFCGPVRHGQLQPEHSYGDVCQRASHHQRDLPETAANKRDSHWCVVQYMCMISSRFDKQSSVPLSSPHVNWARLMHDQVL